MADNSKEVRKQVFDVIGGIAAVVTVLVYLVLCINSQWTFIQDGTVVMKVLTVIKVYAPLVVVAITGIEFFSTKNIVFRIIFYIAIALVVIFMFFPATWSGFVGIIGRI